MGSTGHDPEMSGHDRRNAQLALVGAGVGASGSPWAADLGHVLIQGLSKAVDLLPGSAAPALPAATGNLSACRQHLWKGEAPSLEDSASHNLQPLCFDAFAVGYSPATKTPIWAAQRLNRGELDSARGVRRPDAGEGNADPFFADPRLPSRWQAGPRDFRGFDRGHLAPAGDQPNAGAMAQSFSLANIVPQDSTMNRQAWAKVEADTRRYVRRAKGAVFVVTGAVFASPPARLPSGVAIPSHLFKAVLDETSGRSWAFLMPNDATAVVQPPISLQELRARTGVQAFAGLGQPN